MAQKPSTPKGTRDFGPIEVGKRQFIINTIKKSFELFGFLPIETPSFENIETLTGKYGDEGDQLIFRILRSGDFTRKANGVNWESKNYSALAGEIADKALRYDLTVPFARFVVQHQNELAFPFKRYQIQQVWRADRPQKGRFREFFQCDADVVGSKSLWQEIEFIKLYHQVFSALRLNVTIKVNNRKILAGISEVLKIDDQFESFTVALDKLDKVGIQGVIDELTRKNFNQTAIEEIKKLLSPQSNNVEFLEDLKTLLSDSEIGKEGLKELDFILENSKKLGVKDGALVFDITLARGLNYYTGSIFEVVADDVEMGSIGGGGRYDDLTGIFGLKNMSGIGISFGLDRIYLCLEELDLFPKDSLPKVQALILNFGKEEALHGMQLLDTLRNAGISVELFPDDAKLKKQFDYAVKKGINQVIFMGSEESNSSNVKIKNLETGNEVFVEASNLVCHFYES